MLNHSFSHGLQFRGVYTFSKALDDGDSMNTSVATNSPAFASNPLNPKQADYGRASFDIRHSGVIHATYDLPFGRNKASGDRTWWSTLAGNWQISGIETLLSGLPFTPQLSYNPSNDGDTRNPVRPSLNPAFHRANYPGRPRAIFRSKRIHRSSSQHIRQCATQLPGGPRACRDRFFSNEKDIINRTVKLAVPERVFNIFNRTNLNNPNPVVFTSATSGPSPTAGVITSTTTTSGRFSLGLKLLW